MIGVDLEGISDDDFEELLEEGDGVVGDAFSQRLFGDDDSGESGDDGGDTVHGRVGTEAAAAKPVDQSGGGNFAPCPLPDVTLSRQLFDLFLGTSAEQADFKGFLIEADESEVHGEEAGRAEEWLKARRGWNWRVKG